MYACVSRVCMVFYSDEYLILFSAKTMCLSVFGHLYVFSV